MGLIVAVCLGISVPLYWLWDHQVPDVSPQLDKYYTATHRFRLTTAPVLLSISDSIAPVVVGTRDTLPRRVPHRPCLDGCHAPNGSPTIEQEGMGVLVGHICTSKDG